MSTCLPLAESGNHQAVMLQHDLALLGRDRFRGTRLSPQRAAACRKSHGDSGRPADHLRVDIVAAEGLDTALPLCEIAVADQRMR